jgi:hypothetical protein
MRTTAQIIAFPTPTPVDESDFPPEPLSRDAKALSDALFTAFSEWLDQVDNPTVGTVVVSIVDFALRASETGVADRRVFLSNLADRMRPPPKGDGT